MHRATSKDASRAEVEFGYWTPAFIELHTAATGGAPVDEVGRLEGAEVDELARWSQ